VAKLIYSAITSLDGFVADEGGNFDWAAPDEEVHAYVNDLERTVGTYLYGRRMYEVMVAWETMALAGQSATVQDFARIWRAADKVVYSTTLETVSSARTRIECVFDPDAAEAIEARLVDEYHVFLTPIVVGAGTPSLPHDARLDLDLLDERRFASGVVHLHYRTSA
jgi:dihydrofolate reductase